MKGLNRLKSINASKVVQLLGIATISTKKITPMKGYRVANNKVTDNSNVHQHSPYTDQIVFINRAKTGIQ